MKHEDIDILIALRYPRKVDSNEFLNLCPEGVITRFHDRYILIPTGKVITKEWRCLNILLMYRQYRNFEPDTVETLDEVMFQYLKEYHSGNPL